MSHNYLVLGIDVGTTSVKVCIVKEVGNEILELESKELQSNVPSELGIDGNKQSVPKIISTFNNCLARLPKQLLRHVNRIGICGQMHGIMFWKHDDTTKAWEYVRRDNCVTRFDIIDNNVSNLYTWQDLRCDLDFLNTLPQPESHLNVYSGYGCATLFWMQKNKPELLKMYNCCGTIQDFIVTILCDLPKPIMSVQNAAGWGYFNCATNQWNDEILKNANFPTDLLPTVIESGTVAGYLKEDWYSMRKNVMVSAALGDLQCSALSALENFNDAMLNVSTSAQLAFISRDFDPTFVTVPNKMSPVEYYPYFSGKYLVVAASLNGGNSLATFVQSLQTWLIDLGVTMPQAALWEKVLNLASNDSCTSLIDVKPTLLGERTNPYETASMSNIRLDNLKLGSVFRAICKGIAENLHKKVTRDTLIKSNIVRIIGNGSGLGRNLVLQNEVKQLYDLPLVFTSGGDAAHGAAMSMFAKRRDSFY